MDQRRILIVEDSPTMRQLLVFALRRLKNVEIVEAQDGMDGLRKVSNDHFDLALIDINMPVYDLYMAQFVGGGLDGSIFYQYPLPANTGQIPLIFSGGYHAWISAQYFDGSLEITLNPWTGIAYSGVAHVPAGMSVESLMTGPRDVRLNWAPEIFGTWHDQIIAFKIDDLATFTGDFVQTEGPLGTSFFHFVDFGEAIFMPAVKIIPRLPREK